MLGMLISTLLAVTLMFGLKVLVPACILIGFARSVSVRLSADENPHVRALHRDSQLLFCLVLFLGLGSYLFGIFQDSPQLIKGGAWVMLGSVVLGILAPIGIWLRLEIQRMFSKSGE